MPNLPILTRTQARSLVITTLGLAKRPTRQARKADLVAAIRNIHNLQIDTISVVARAHHHILWSRVGDYAPEWLDDLHAGGQLFEYFAHGVGLMPIENFPIHRTLMLNKFMGWKGVQKWGEENQETIAQVLEYIRENGATKSSDFMGPKPAGGWWVWKDEKVALEYLYYRGDLMIARREGFQRVYDLRERVLPDWDDDKAYSYEDAVRALTLNAVKALGVARQDWAASYFYLPKKEVWAVLPRLESEGMIQRVGIQGMEGHGDFYVHTENAGLLEKGLEARLRASRTTLLSPFDPIVTDRSRGRDLFDFDYSIECYTPAAKRVYGYYTLPILHKGRLVGRLDAKAWRKERCLQVIKIFLEPTEKPTAELAVSLADTLREYAAWLGLERVGVDASQPEEFLPLLRGQL